MAEKRLLLHLISSRTKYDVPCAQVVPTFGIEMGWRWITACIFRRSEPRPLRVTFHAHDRSEFTSVDAWAVTIIQFTSTAMGSRRWSEEKDRIDTSFLDQKQ